MKNLAGCLVARLADQDETYEESLIVEINRVISPPKPVTAEDVHIRAMYIVSDQINSQGGRFPEEELNRLTELLADCPVMVGHQRDSLPVARNFKAMTVEQDSRIWVKSYFYWMRDNEEAEMLRQNIDGGIYKECSISFLFLVPECSICGNDIRTCRHLPFREYETASGRKEIAHFRYRQIEKVLETSLVFRGAVPETRITDKLSSSGAENTAFDPATGKPFAKDGQPGNIPSVGNGWCHALPAFHTPDSFVPDDTVTALYAFPHQPGLMVTVVKKTRGIEVAASPLLPDSARDEVVRVFTSLAEESFAVDCLLYATRGNDRLNSCGLIRLLKSGDKSHRLRLRLCDIHELSGADTDNEPFERRLEIIDRLVHSAQHPRLEALSPKRIDPESWPKQIGGGNWKQYHFGYEVVAIHDRGVMTRTVIRQKPVIPAAVTEVLEKGKSHCRYRLAWPGSDHHPLTMAAPSSAGLEMGMAVLVELPPEKGASGHGPAVLVDLLPGIELTGNNAAGVRPEISGPSLQVTCEGDILTVLFDDGHMRRQLTVRHFSSRLFQLGRRFIADMTAAEQGESFNLLMAEIRPASVKNADQSMHIQLRQDTVPFGTYRKLWVRPVLLGGRVRHLFYGGVS